MKIYDASGFDSSLTGSFSGSFSGDGTSIVNVQTSSFAFTASYAENAGGVSDYTDLVNIPSNIVSSSAQISAFNFVTTSISVVSSSQQITYNEVSNIPQGIISSSKQLPSNIISSSTQLTNTSITGSFTGSFVGDGSLLTNITVVSQSLVEETFAVTGSHTVRHNFGTKNVLTQVFDVNDFVITPSNIQTVDNSTVKISFSTSESGRVVVVKGGHVVTALQSTNSSSYADTAVSASNSNLATSVHNNYLLSGSIKFWSGPKQVYDSISSSADPNTVYFVKD